MKTAIVTDSNSGIFPDQGKELGIFVLPMPVILDGKEYFEGVDLTHQEFYQRMEAGADASTSQPAPGDVLAMWERVLDEGYDEIVHIPMSSGLSASHATALGLAGEFDGRVQVVDNHRVSVSQYDSVMDALALVKEDLDAKAVRAELERGGMDSVIYLGVDTLKYFKKNGRCTAATAALGTVLNIKPLLKCDGERFDAVAKIRGVAACRKRIGECAAEAARELAEKGYPVSIGIAGSFADPEEEAQWVEQIQEAVSPAAKVSFHYEPLSFSVTCHTGPNAFGVGISRRLRIG